MQVQNAIGKLGWRRQKASWTVRTARFLGRSPKIAMFAGAVALLGGARQAQKRLSQG